jgi:tartrate dehydrogenase/decarboxylase / D-malate dehydrogenase
LVVAREVAQDVSVMTRPGVQRIMRYAIALARSRLRKLLTVITKSNAQRHAMVMWDEIAAEVAQEYPDVTWGQDAGRRDDHAHGRRPQTPDTIVATNLHADILSDLAARWPDRSASHRRRTSIPSAPRRRWASPTRSRHSGRRR